jgi:hypothetical protein
LAGGQQLAGQNYKNCIRQEAGHCCIEYIPTTYSIDPIACLATGTRCASVSTCATEYILIPEVQNESGADQPGSFDRYTKCDNLLLLIHLNRFCGLFINPTGITTTNQPVTTCKSPFEVTHTTDQTNLNNAVASIATGFSFNYRQIPGNC